MIGATSLLKVTAAVTDAVETSSEIELKTEIKHQEFIGCSRKVGTKNGRNADEPDEHASTQSGREHCALHASFVRRRGDGVEKSSVRSAMFIATRAAQSAKLRRSGMCLCSLGHCRVFFWGHGRIHAAPPELGGASPSLLL